MQANANQISFFIVVTTAIIFLLATVAITMLYLYQKRQLIHQRHLNQLKMEFERNLLKAQVEIQEETFQAISREIHDHINLSLTLVKLNLNTIDWTDVPVASKSMKSTVKLLTTAINELANLSRSMNTELIRNLGLIKAIKNETEKLEEMARIAVRYEVKGEPVFMDCEKELVVFRIVQEAFNNIIKHAKASKVWLELRYNSHYLDVMIRDNGIGFVKEEVCGEKATTHAGLINMQRRAKLFGGNFLLETRPERGTQILISVPYY